MPGNYIQIGGKKRTIKFDESKVKRDEQGRFAKRDSGAGVKSTDKYIPGTQLLTKGERLRRNPNSSLMGPAVEARRSGESSLQFKRRLDKARRDYNRLMNGKPPSKR